VTENKDFIERKREVVSFSPNDKASVDSFLQVGFAQLVECSSFRSQLLHIYYSTSGLLSLLKNILLLNAGGEGQQNRFIHSVLCIRS
jgi:hypothetical protein